MNELEARKEMAAQVMNVQYLAEVPEEQLQLEACEKYPISNLSALGVGFQPLVSAVQSITTGAGGSGIYFVNTKGKTMMQFKDGSGFLGSLIGKDGAVGGGQASLTQLPCDPTMFCMAAALANIEKKLDDISKMQQEMMDYLKVAERAKLRGDLNILIDVLNNYKFNWNNEKYKTNKHILVQDIRKDAEQSILLHRDLINKKLSKKGLFHSDQEVKTTLQQLQSEMKEYQLSLYLYSFSSFLEVMLLENFDAGYLSSVSRQIEADSLQYRELYTVCYNLIEKMSSKSVESFLMNGLAGVSKGAGEVISKIPLVNKATVDEALIGAESTLKKKNEEKTNHAMKVLVTTSANCTAPFVDSIKKVNRIYNEPMEVLFDQKNIYFISQDSANQEMPSTED
ncbi:MAG: hypothetical protein LKF79_05160 [Solobacterium sp.]|jgi:hypothetical protein|nr:hypothetical protein [Solobacterium sp.]MCH4266011.1 hypothetical protein [Solobacterium sp.]